MDWWLAKWGRAEPLTREDVERLIEANGSTAQGLNLSGRDLQGADLGGANLQGAHLMGANLQGADLVLANLQGAHLGGANLQGANLFGANLQGAVLWDANLQGAELGDANLQGADLRGANLDGADFEGWGEEWTNMEGVRLYGATITETTKLRRVRWGKRMTLGDEVDKHWEEALEPYRDLKQWHQRTGDYDTADAFQYREWECRRKLAQQQWRLWEILELWLYRLLSGYGARPWRVIGVSAVMVLLFALLYMPWNGVDVSSTGMGNFLAHSWKALYFSSLSFTGVGYGGWVESGDIAPADWTKHLGVVEALFGIFLIALFLVTFTRKMSR
ncbi:MAG: putative Voltage-gated potassium channel [Dehalococcoidia bacterium]|nr:putative Voltage-gated potassium channel [Dehalococcoidia bacterium]